MKFRKFTLPVLYCLGAAFTGGVSGCGGGGSSNATSQVRYYNGLISGTGNVDFATRSILVENSVKMGFVEPSSTSPSTNNPKGSPYYAAVAAGGSDVNGVTTTAYYAGSDFVSPIASGSSILDTFNPGTTNGTYTFVLAGIAGTTGTTAPQILRFLDNPSIPTGTTAAYVRVINLVPTTSGSISLYNNGQAISTGASAFGFNGITYPNTSTQSGGAYLPISIVSGSAPALSIVDNSNNVLVNSISLSGLPGGGLQAGESYTIFVVGEPGTTAVTADVAIDYPPAS